MKEYRNNGSERAMNKCTRECSRTLSKKESRNSDLAEFFRTRRFPGKPSRGGLGPLIKEFWSDVKIRFCEDEVF